MKRDLLSIYRVDVAESTILNFFIKLGYKAKITIFASQAIRAQFIMDVSLYNPDMINFIDVTGTDRRETIRKYRYSLRPEASS